MQDLLAREEAILLENGPDSYLLDRFARASLPVGIEELAVRDLEAFFADVAVRELRPQQHLVIHVTDESLSVEEVLAATAQLAVAAVAQGMCEIRLHLRSSERDWSPLIHWLARLREHYIPNPQRGMVTIDCPFAPLAEPVLEQIFRLGVHCRYVSGWWPDCPSAAYLRITERGLEDLARFGFYVPVVWYVHAGNIDGMMQSVRHSLLRNYNAGVSLPLVSASPFYDFARGTPSLPDAGKYARLLFEVYETFPHYDLAFSPVRELAELAASGGWDTTQSIPPRWQVLLRASVPVLVYRHVPAIGRAWFTTDEIAGMVPAELQRRLYEFQKARFELSCNPLCGRCEWRHVCGGMDYANGDFNASDAQFSPDTYFDSNCYHRAAFLEMFVRQRLSAGGERS